MVIGTQADPWKDKYEIPTGRVAHCLSTRTRLYLDGLIISQASTSRVRPPRDKPRQKVDHLRSKNLLAFANTIWKDATVIQLPIT